MTDRELVVGIGAARFLEPDLALDLAPGHPSQHGAFELALRLNDDVIMQADPRVGLMHRSTEKLFEARDYRQLMMLANRHDWLSPFASELAIALVLESAMGITAPERAIWMRTLLAELNRASTAMLLIGTGVRQAASVLDDRAALVELQHNATGNRVHPMVNRIGGLALGLDAQWLDALDRVLDQVDAGRAGITAVVDQALHPMRGRAVLDRADAITFAASGPVARSSGLDLDVRRHHPYLAYSDCPMATAPQANVTAGDIPARYQALGSDLDQAIAIMRRCAEQLRQLGLGPINVPLPKVVRAPEGIHYGQVEGPLGAIGVLLASTGDKTPLRLKLRTPSFSHVQAMSRALVGLRLEHLPAAVMSFFCVSGDIDR